MSAAEKMEIAELVAELRALREENRQLLGSIRDELRRGGKSHLSRAQAAKVLGIGKDRVYELVAEGKIQTVRGPTGKPLITREEIARIGRVPELLARDRRGRPKRVKQAEPSAAQKIAAWRP